MHMKKMMAALALAGVGVAFADVAVTDVKIQPRTPWNGLVDVEYTLACDDPEADVYVNPVGYDGDRRITLFPQAFTGESAEGPVKAGKHTLVWDAVKDFGHAFSCAHFQLKFYAGKRLAPYVVIDVSSGSTSTNYPVRFEMKGPDLTKDTCRTDEIWMRLVPPGEFWMGSPENEVGRNYDEDLHHVTLTKPFYIGVFEMTKGQWKNVMGSDYSGYFSGANKLQRPVERIYRYYNSSSSTIIAQTIGCSYNPAATTLTSGFLGTLCNRAHVGGFNLPTEAQWEYACRAGEMTALNNGANLDDLMDSSNLNSISRYTANGYNNQSYGPSDVVLGTATVGSYQPNRLGLYDMIGNVAEMCRDEHTEHLGWAAVVNPSVVTVSHSGSYYYYRYVLKGGCWKSAARYCRSASRSSNWSDSGSDVVWAGVYYNGSRNGELSSDSTGFRLYSDASF